MAGKMPSNASVTIDGLVVNTFSTLAGISALTDGNGMPSMGTMASTFEFSSDIHDQKAIPFDTVRKLFNLCNQPVKDKVKDIKIEFWTDESRVDVILTLSFKGWVSSWTVTSGGGNNHVLAFTVQPVLDKNQFIDLKIGN